MSKRVTVNVEVMLEKFNTILASGLVPQKHKAGVASAVEIMLFESNRYGGFRYLNMSYNDNSEQFDIVPDTEYNRQYFAKNM